MTRPEKAQQRKMTCSEMQCCAREKFEDSVVLFSDIWCIIVTLCLIGFTMFHTTWGKRGPSRRTNWTLRVLEPMSQLAEQDWLDCFHSQQIAMSVTPSYVFCWVTCNLQTILEKLTKRPARAYSEHILSIFWAHSSSHIPLYTRQSAHFYLWGHWGGDGSHQRL